MAAEGGRVGCFAQGAVDRLQHARKIAIHIVVPESKNAKTGPFERAVAISIARSMFVEIVLAAIDFDDETMLKADKVDNESLAWGLPAEMVAAAAP